MIKQALIGLGVVSLAFSAASFAGEPEADNNNLYIYIKNASTSTRDILVTPGSARGVSQYQQGNDINGATVQRLAKGQEAVGDVYSKRVPRVGDYTVSFLKNGKEYSCTFAMTWGSQPTPVAGDAECRNVYTPKIDPRKQIGDYEVEAQTLTFNIT